MFLIPVIDNLDFLLLDLHVLYAPFPKTVFHLSVACPSAELQSATD